MKLFQCTTSHFYPQNEAIFNVQLSHFHPQNETVSMYNFQRWDSERRQLRLQQVGGGGEEQAQRGGDAAVQVGGAKSRFQFRAELGTFGIF